MILVLSQANYDSTTEEVVDWVRALGGDCVRLNGDDVGAAQPFALEFDGAGPHLRFTLDGRAFSSREVRAVWMRRWGRTESTAPVRAAPGLESLAARMNTHLTNELNAVARGLFAALQGARWLTRPGDISVNKLDVLRAAVEVGLEIPPTLVTNERGEIERFRQKHGGIITKSIGGADIFPFYGKSFALYTAKVKDEDVAALPESPFPTLVQAMVEKEFEVRTFYLGGEMHSMAIFSQGDEETSVDFRRYNLQRPNRTVPYRLPEEVAGRVRALMQALEQDTGSIDLIRTPDGRHVFLEVNPAGQFGMVSRPCNYRLEKRVAGYLMQQSPDVDR
jgi:ATP-GRASP peptide maturase of grasp-with-spasm system